jgi:tetratricopeptide (TPR) repeat protein
MCILVLVALCLSCSERTSKKKMRKNPIVGALYLKASTFLRTLPNKDSLNMAGHLIDSAISIDPDDEKLYWIRIEIYGLLDKPDSSIITANKLGTRNPDNYYPYLAKGQVFKTLNRIDSSKYNFLRALEIINKDASQVGGPSNRDFMKIAIYRDLGDTVNYRNQIRFFKNEYGDDPRFKEIIEHL